MGQEDAPAAPDAPLALSLTLSAAAYRPGGALTALLRAAAADPAAVELLELEVGFAGEERVDKAWVAPGYRRGVPPAREDRRRAARPVAAARLQAATRGGFAGAPARRFVVRAPLPGWLPPTFRGSAARYTYALEAAVKYRLTPATPPPGADGRAPAAAAPAAVATATARVEVVVLPSAEAAAAAAAAAAAGEVAWPEGDGGGGGDVFPPADAAAIKCWEVGAGTSVEDAVGHIAALALSAPAPAGPPRSPERRRAGGGGGAPFAAAAENGAGEGDALLAGRVFVDGVADPPPRRPPALRVSIDPGAAGGAPLPTPGGAAPTPGAGRPADPGAVRSYALRVGAHPLVRVALHPPPEGALAPGATLAGTLDFVQGAAAAAGGDEGGGGAAAPPGGGARCVQVLITLETEEAVAPRWRPGKPAAGGGSLRRVWDEQLEATADLACTHFVFTLPPEGPPSFAAPLLAVRWVLRFQFTAAVPRARGGADVETLNWSLPLAVVA